MSRFFQPVCLNILSSLGGFAATLPEGESKNYCLILSLPLGGKVLNVSEADEGHSNFLKPVFYFLNILNIKVLKIKKLVHFRIISFF